MNIEDVVQGALDEMDYKTGLGNFGQDASASIPAQLHFVEGVNQNTNRFHDALDERGFSKIDSNPEQDWRDGGPYYDGEICSEDHYHRMHVIVFRQNTVRLYPLDDYIPTHDELEDIVESLEIGFGSKLEHRPIERENTD